MFYGGGARLLGDQVIAVVCVAAFSFALTWIIATGISKTIGLRVAPGSEARLDQVQQGMDAYHYEHVWNLPGATAPPRPALAVPRPALEPAAAQAPADVRLVTALINPDDMDSRQMTGDLLQAGGSSIVISEVNLYTGDDSQVVRSQARPVDFPDRLRVEVLVPAPQLECVLRVLRRGTRDGTRGEYIRVTRPEAVIGQHLSPRHLQVSDSP